MADPFHTLFQKEVIKQRNWNSEWEKDFEPVTVDDFCAIRAHFHNAIPEVKYDIIITPKMSFGTGHHATTYMMIAAMEHLDLNGKNLYWISGQEPAVLAILAEKWERDPFWRSIQTSGALTMPGKMLAINGCETVQIELSDSLSGTGRFDIILANINLRGDT